MLEVLNATRADLVDFVVEVGERGDAGYLRLSLPGKPDRWAVVTSPGDRWFSVDIDGGFSLNHFEEDTPDEEAERWLRRYLEVAVEYLRGTPRPTPSGRLRLPVVRVPTSEGEVVLRRSVGGSLKDLFARARRS